LLPAASDGGQPDVVSASRKELSNQITGANSRRAIQFDMIESHNTVVAGASALPAAVAQFDR
jgi:hypothetical protein